MSLHNSRGNNQDSYSGIQRDSALFKAYEDSHAFSDVDNEPSSQHHTLGWGFNQAAPGHEAWKIIQDIIKLYSQSWVVVHHGSNPDEERPVGSVVYWIGSATPNNARPFDFWLASDLEPE